MIDTAPIHINPLGEFEGDDVISTTVAITNSGDGLSEALTVFPIKLHIGDRLKIVLDCEVTAVTFEPIKQTSALNRKARLKAEGATIIDDDVVDAALEKTKIAIEEHSGVHRLDFGKDNDPADEPGDGDE